MCVLLGNSRYTFNQEYSRYNVWSMYLWFTTKIISRIIGLMSKVFAKGPGDEGSIQGRAITKI